MSTPPNFQSSFDWSQTYLNNPLNKGDKEGGLSIFLVIFLLVLAMAWWWIFYGSSMIRRSDQSNGVPLAGLDDLKRGAIQGKVTMTVKSNGMVSAA